MTEHKSFKRLVRARMEKTGESYTSARARLPTWVVRILSVLRFIVFFSIGGFFAFAIQFHSLSIANFLACHPSNVSRALQKS